MSTGKTGAFLLFAIDSTIDVEFIIKYSKNKFFIIGRYEGDASTTAVSIGSQVMHILTVMTAGLVMGATAGIERAVGGGFPGKSRNLPFEGTLAVGEIFPLRPYLFGAG